MSSFPDEFLGLRIAYSGLFSKPVFVNAGLLLAGAILAPGKSTVTCVLRVLGLSQEAKFHKYHRVLSLARWSALTGARILLGQLLHAFLAAGPVVVGIDETLERRWGSKLKKRGHLPRQCTQLPLPLCQVQRPALDQPDAAGAHPLGRTGVGPAFFDVAGRQRALCQRSGERAQENH